MANSIDHTNSAYSRALRAEREANDRVNDARKRVQRAQTQADDDVDEIRRKHAVQVEKEYLSHEDQLASIRDDGYEKVRSAIRTQQNELNRIRRDGEADVSKKENYYRHAAYQLENDGSKKIQEEQLRQFAALEYERNRGDIERRVLESDNQQKANIIRTEGQEQRGDLRRSNRKEYEELKESYRQANLESESQYKQDHEYLTSKHREVLNRIYNSASENIRHVRSDTSRNLSAYATRQADPFYKLVTLEPNVSDFGDEYVIEVDIPQHEQEHISVSVNDSQLTISGYRRNEETLDLGEGHKQSTASFQSYSEVVPLEWPVQENLLSREFEGDRLTVRVPKAGRHSKQPYNARTKVERVEVETPRFPKNIPTDPDAKAEESQKHETNKNRPNPEEWAGRPLD